MLEDIYTCSNTAYYCSELHRPGPRSVEAAQCYREQSTQELHHSALSEVAQPQRSD